MSLLEHIYRKGQAKKRYALLVALLLYGAVAFGQSTGNIARDRPTTASSVETNTSFAASNAVDGNAGTRWASNFNDTEWIYIDLGTIHSIDRVKLTWEAAYPSIYEIQTSYNRNDWSRIIRVSHETGKNTPFADDLSGLSGSGRYVRMRGVDRATGYGYSLWEFEVYEQQFVTGATVCGGESATLHATGAPLAGSYRWYTAASGGTAIAGETEASFITPALAATTTYYVSIVDDYGAEHERRAVTATIKPIPDLSQTPTLNLISSYPFTGNVTDASGNSNHGAVQGGASPARDRNYSTNSAYSFDGIDDHITTTRQYAAPGPQELSISMWFNTTTGGGKMIGYGSSQSGLSTNNDRHIYMNSSGQLYFGVYFDGGGKTIKTSAAYNDGQWHHVVATLSGNGIKLYVDGVLQAINSTYTGAQNFAGYWRIGYDKLNGWTGGTGNYYKGLLDDINIYYREITTEEIFQLRGAGTEPVCAGSSLNLKANAVAGATYAWTGPNGFTSSERNSSILNATTAATGTYTLTVTANGCQTLMIVAAEVKAMPAASFTAPAEVFTAENATITYTGTPLSGAGYTLNTDGGIIVSGTGPGPYELQWNTPGIKSISLQVNLNGCVAEENRTIKVNSAYVWNGSIDSDFENSLNWTPNEVPGADDAATIVAAENNPVLDVNATVRNFTITSGNLTLNNNATLSVNGITQFTGGTISGTLNLVCSQVTFTGTTFTAAINTTCDNIYFNGAVFQNMATFTKSAGNAVDNIGNGGSVFNASTTIINSSSSRLVLANATADDFNRNVTFDNQGSGTIEVSHNSHSTFAGDITVNTGTTVTFGGGSGSAILDGGNDQHIYKSGSAAVTFNRLKVNKTAGNIILNTPVTIIADLTLTQQNIVSSATNPLNFLPGATVSETSDYSFVEGPVRRDGSGSFTFPVGKSNRYRPISIAPEAESSFMAEYFATNSADLYPHSSRDFGDISRISACEYWMLDRISGTAASSVTLSWSSPTACEITEPGDLLVAHWNGSQWESYGNGGTTGTAETGTVTTNGGASTFSPFTIGSGTPANPLPVELVSFHAQRKGSTVNLEWSTATEINNQGFWVERSEDWRNFTPLAFVVGGNNSNTQRKYSHTDFLPLPGTTYYRLKQVDIDGTETYSKIVMVRMTGMTYLMIKPNPVTDKVELSWFPENTGTWEVCITDVSGRKLYRSTLSNKDNKGSLTVNMGNYPSGLYIVTVGNNEGMVYRKKLMKE